MSNDVSTPLTIQRNKTEGRRGWVGWQADKDRKLVLEIMENLYQRKEREERNNVIYNKT